MNGFRRLTAATLMAVAALFLCACGSRAVLEVDCNTFQQHQNLSKEIAVANGQSFTITLCANPSTGHQWGEAQISDLAVLLQEDRVYKAPGSVRPPAPGSAGQETWTFRAVGSGGTTVHLEYGQPWEGGTKAAWTMTLTIVVE